MDPLSVAANIIAVTGAAANISKKLRELSRLRHAPEQIIVLENEVCLQFLYRKLDVESLQVSDFRSVLVTVNETLRKLRETSAIEESLELERSIQRLVETAITHLDEMNVILESSFIRNLDSTKSDQAKISWGKWLRKNGQLQRLSATLRDIRRDISAALTIVTASDAPRVRAHLESISFIIDENRAAATRALENFDTQSESVTQQVAGIQSSLGNLEKTFQRLQVAQQQPSVLNEIDEFSGNRSQSQRPIFRVRTTLQKSCSKSCRCRCHRRTSLSSPKWMKDILGLMFIDYSGKPIIGSQTCDEKMCRQQEKSLLKINYFFPIWFLQRMIIFQKYSNSFLAGEHLISVRTPRVVDLYCDQMKVVQSGSVGAMQALFSQYLASPFDTNAAGETLLHKALAWKRVDMCRLLLNESANATQESIEDGTPIDIVWDLILQGPQDSINQALKAVFEPLLDPDTDLQSKRFSIIHQSVLGLNYLNLEDYLLLTTAEIESHCSMGRTPLFWAASSGNLPAVSTLLKYGADIEFVDAKGQNVIHRSIVTPDVQLLKTILREASTREPSPCNHATPKRSDAFEGDQRPPPCMECPSDSLVQSLINKEDNWGWSPLSFCAEFNRPDHAKVLLDCGAAMQTDRESLAPPLIAAIQTGAIGVLKHLLKRGARTDVKDSYDRDGVLHLAATHGNPEVFELLAQYNNCCISTCDEDSQGLTPLQSFDMVRSKYTTEDAQTFSESREAFLVLLKKIEQWNLDHGGLKDKDNLGPALAVPEISKTASTHPDDDDDFFDASSTFGDS